MASGYEENKLKIIHKAPSAPAREARDDFFNFLFFLIQSWGWPPAMRKI